jgi:hypothetical protein
MPENATTAPPYLTYSDLLDRLNRAADELSALLRIPHQREGAWEAQHVGALESELTAILAVLRGGDEL